MLDMRKSSFQPNYAVPPGRTLRETLEFLGMSQTELATRTGRPKKTINEIILGKAAITAETALQLERVLGVPASFWNNLERNYRETLTRLEDEKHLLSKKEWVGRFPIPALRRAGWLPKEESEVGKLKALLNFFGVAGIKEWMAFWQSPQAAYRTSAAFQRNPYAVSAWLRQGEIEAQKFGCKPFGAGSFRAALREIRALTLEPPEVFEPRMKEVCLEAGVAVVFVPELSGTRVFGATRWLTPDRALMQLSLRGKTDDQIWFTFFREAGHILLHGKRDVFIETTCGNSEQSTTNDKEIEADRFAQDFLIPLREYQDFRSSQRFGMKSVREFATRLGIAQESWWGDFNMTKQFRFPKEIGLRGAFAFQAINQCEVLFKLSDSVCQRVAAMARADKLT